MSKKYRTTKSSPNFVSRQSEAILKRTARFTPSMLPDPRIAAPLRARTGFNRKKLMTKYLTLCVAVFAFSVSSFAQTSPSAFPNIDIINFGRMDDRFFRGGQPEPGDYAALKELGVNTVIDLRNDPTAYEKNEVESLGMRYVNIPMSGWKYAKDSQVDQVMKLINDPATGVIYLHCKAGRHRTGLAGAVYRLENYGWDYGTAYKEMKNYNYSSWPVHYNIKTYVQDYFKKNKSKVGAVKPSIEAPKQNTEAAATKAGN